MRRGWQGRGARVLRQWRVLVALHGGPKTLDQLAARCGCTPRTIRRDLDVLREVPLPIGIDRRLTPFGTVTLYALTSMAWPKHQPTPIAEVHRAG